MTPHELSMDADVMTILSALTAAASGPGVSGTRCAGMPEDLAPAGYRRAQLADEQDDDDLDDDELDDDEDDDEDDEVEVDEDGDEEDEDDDWEEDDEDDDGPLQVSG